VRTRIERQRDSAAMHQAVADANARADAAQRMAEQQLKALGDVKAQIEEYWDANSCQ
jgi:hypothetical protein